MIEAAKITNFRWHDLRHTFASRLIMAGVSLRAVQALLAHERIETTLRYTHLGDAHLKDAVERLTVKASGTTISTEQSSASEAKGAVSA